MGVETWGTMLALLLFGAASSAIAQADATGAPCGPLHPEGQYGPYDFRKDKDALPIVLGAHFTPIVEALIAGNRSATPGGDIDYTLRAIPNHPNALLSMMLLGEKEKTQKPRNSRYTVECWFERAIRFRPDDSVVRMLYTTYLTKNNRKADAMKQLDIVLKTAEDNPFTYNNVGLLYFDLGEYDKALVQAHKSIALGLNRPDLKDKLKSVGKWTEPIAPPADADASVTARPASAPGTP